MSKRKPNPAKQPAMLLLDLMNHDMQRSLLAASGEYDDEVEERMNKERKEKEEALMSTPIFSPRDVEAKLRVVWGELTGRGMFDGPQPHHDMMYRKFHAVLEELGHLSHFDSGPGR